MNPLTLIDFLETHGKTICLPIVIGKNRPLIFKSWSPGKELVEGYYGIPVPDNDQIMTPDLVICLLLHMTLMECSQLWRGFTIENQPFACGNKRDIWPCIFRTKKLSRSTIRGA